MKIKAYKTNLGLFVNPESSVYSSHRLNGSIPLVSGWRHLKDVEEITSCEILKPGEKKLVSHILKISSVACEAIPLKLLPEQVEMYYDDDSESYLWKSFSDYQALYKPEHETLPPVWEVIPFEVEVVREIVIDNYAEPIKMSVGTNVRIQQPSWNSSEELSKVVLYEDIERILTPEFLLHERPCQLAPSQVYSIVRNWIKLNINPKAAFISSDYDFCFTVKRRIAIKPVVVKTEIKKQNGRSYASPKFHTKQLASKEEILFEMAPSAYSKYPVIEQWHAANLKEMAAQLKNYLENLMDEINAEAVECEHCHGVGAIVQKIDTNDRSSV